MIIVNRFLPVFSLEQAIKTGDLKLSLPVLSPEWNIKIKFKITSFLSTQYCGIMSMQHHFFNVQYGIRTPAISLNTHTSKIIIASAISGNANKYFVTPLQLNTWYDIVVDQGYVGNGIYRYSIVVNGSQIFAIDNTQAVQFYDVGVYAGYRASESCIGVISYLEITNFL